MRFLPDAPRPLVNGLLKSGLFPNTEEVKQKLLTLSTEKLKECMNSHVACVTLAA